MTTLYPIVLETEESGAVSIYVTGVAVHAAAETHAKAERTRRAVLTEYLNVHPASRPDARIRIARSSDRGKRKVDTSASPPWSVPIGAPRKHAPREQMAGWVGDLASAAFRGHKMVPHFSSANTKPPATSCC
jgi:hypothetical protein